MKTTKFELLEAVVAAEEITQQELMEWINNRNSSVIPTELPIAYRKGSELTIENGLDLRRKSEVWGLQLRSGLVVALTVSEKQMYDGELEMLAYHLRFNGMPGRVPSLAALYDRMNDPNKREEKQAFNATVKILNQNGIKADNYGGDVWCNRALGNYCYSFDTLEKYEQSRNFPLWGCRVTIEF